MNVQEFLRAIEIIGKYDPSIKIAPMYAEHDQLWVGSDESYEKMSDEDKKEMDDLIWFTDADSWSCYT
uniref:Uncharacterized protein n=1 Tax=viral metagenome TaxID=1070528 RepID=A0A6H1ZJB3_9ZZZZ